MARRPNAKASFKEQLDEYAEKYEAYSDIYGDPVQTIFAVMASLRTEITPELRVKCAEILMSYRHPRLKALDNAPGGAQPVNLYFNGVPMNQPPLVAEKPKVVFDINKSAPKAASTALVIIPKKDYGDDETGFEDLE